MFIFDTQCKINAWQHNKLLCAMLVALSLITVACQEHSPEFSDPMAKVWVEIDWSGFGKNEPSRITVLFHNIETGQLTKATGNEVDSIESCLTPGRYWAMAFNLSAENSSNVRFRGLESSETAEAYVAELLTPKWYTTPVAAGSYLASQPEWLAVDTIMTRTVETPAPGTQTEAQSIGTLRPQNIIYTLHVLINIENIGSLLAARGAISGLASGRRLAGDYPNDNETTVTQLIESDNWSCSRAPSAPGMGFVKAGIRCFGLPANHGGTPEENILEFQALLADGKTVERYRIPVGHLIAESNAAPDRRGDNLELKLELTLDSPLPPSSSDTGIDVWFNDWDEQIDFNVPI